MFVLGMDVPPKEDSATLVRVGSFRKRPLEISESVDGVSSNSDRLALVIYIYVVYSYLRFPKQQPSVLGVTDWASHLFTSTLEVSG